MNKFHDIKVMSLPHEALKNDIEKFKKMVIYKEDNEKDNIDGLSKKQIARTAFPLSDGNHEIGIGKRYTSIIEEFSKIARAREDVVKMRKKKNQMQQKLIDSRGATRRSLSTNVEGQPH